MLNLTIPMLVDGMDDVVNQAFAAWPERIYIINGGRISYFGGPGPFGFSVDEAEAALRKLI